MKLKTCLLLLLWTTLALGLRLTQLTAKSPWTDEFSTLVFSLGNSYRTVSLDQAVSLDELLQPLQINSDANAIQVIQNLLTQSNHPPLYFILAHWWMQLYGGSGLVSLWVARSLSAIFGALSIPAIYLLGAFAFRSRLVGQIAAAMMAVSPYGIFLAQEARHYTLAILLVIASFGCLIAAIRHTQNQTKLPTLTVISWILVNILGIATHYFFVLTLATEAFVLLWEYPWKKKTLNAPWGQICVVAVATAIGGIVWLPIFLQNNSELTQWIENGESSQVLALLNPIFQILAAWITMVSLLPVEASALPVVIASGFVMMVFFVWAIPLLWRGFIANLQQPKTRAITQVFARIVASAIAIFFLFTYILGIDLTRGARYNFIYFPAVIVLVAASLAICWNPAINKLSSGKTAVALIWLMGLLSAVTVINNLGYQKYYRPDLFVQLVEKNSNSLPVLIATTHKTHVQTGEMMGIAREFKLEETPAKAEFLLAHQSQNADTSAAILQNAVSQKLLPFDLWLVNFYAPVKLNQCNPDTSISKNQPVDGYNYELYHCQN
ncbi:glycosyltransferase family 39 protein [Chlorogloea sp. CCALA 695]|uniref:glycosyltransferase family 39 protein n=1 Tax=Chlorogloea sp. CCALA 695 TaxID=2107693 RepID=UPI000D075397|nr:glycosyltransferase family 39 protein [Chlorogloea sp. CCALA 695]PSB32253.1 glycosyltransferase [Chlorogloea sp. CCALA 695]